MAEAGKVDARNVIRCNPMSAAMSWRITTSVEGFGRIAIRERRYVVGYSKRANNRDHGLLFIVRDVDYLPDLIEQLRFAFLQPRHNCRAFWRGQRRKRSTRRDNGG